jgi:hypothetical protein
MTFAETQSISVSEYLRSRFYCVSSVQQGRRIFWKWSVNFHLCLINFNVMQEWWALKQGEGHMCRVAISLVSGMAILMAQMPPGFAQNAVSPPARSAAISPAQDVSPSPAILDAFKAFPKGGDLLSKRIEDIIVMDSKLAPGVAKYLQTAPELNKEQKLAALRGLAAALNRLGIQAADMAVPPPYKAPPPVYTEFSVLPLLLGVGAIAGLVCIAVCGGDDDAPPVPVSP